MRHELYGPCPKKHYPTLNSDTYCLYNDPYGQRSEKAEKILEDRITESFIGRKKWSRHWRIEFLQVFSHKLPHSWRVVKHFVWYIWFCQEEYFPGLSCSVSHFCFLSTVLLSWECCSHVHFTLSTTPLLNSYPWTMSSHSSLLGPQSLQS